MASSKPIRLALVGAGIFMRTVHLPALKLLRDQFEIVAVCSRTHDSALRLAGELDQPVDIATDFSELLKRDDIEAVDIAVPILAMPPLIQAALKAGKHVISEKPIAATVAAGRDLLAAQPDNRVWMVAENWRYIPTVIDAAERIQHGDIGAIRMVSLALPIAMNANNKYFHTPWRRSGAVPGGYVLDTGVHHVAGLRLMLGEISRVSAVATLHNPDLPPIDTLNAMLEFDSGVMGSYALTFAVTAGVYAGIQVVGVEGSLHVSGVDLRLVRGNESEVLSRAVHPTDGMVGQMTAFADAIRKGTPHRNTPVQALQDVAVIEALLAAAASSEWVEPARFVTT